MAYGSRRPSPVSEAFTLSPLPYPVLFLLSVVMIFLGTSWYFSYEDAVESAEDQFNWAIMAAPLLLLLAVRWLSSIEDPDRLFYLSPDERRRRSHHRPSEGSSPWVVGVLIIVLLVMVSYQSTFHDKWFA
ncbi:uncharacterized protein LOC131229901 [Magnolia sinica]|uniref:uncharacterized protein LOC131229901 n=1 Tax=Magnolia sinica TaxID=86752 RepID=UPI0026598CC2|nr:uncharacterized protein LOC131229901 [Magnolia sinica]